MEADRQAFEQNLVKEISYPLFSSKGWIKFLGIILLIYGIFIAISIIGLVVAWLPIWIGILLIQTTSRIEQAQAMGNKEALINAQNSLSTYFTVYGVLALLGIIIGVVAAIVLIATGILTNFHEYIPDYY